MCSCLHSPKLVVLSCDAETPILKLAISSVGENQKDKYFSEKATDSERLPGGAFLNSLLSLDISSKMSSIKFRVQSNYLYLLRYYLNYINLTQAWYEYLHAQECMTTSKTSVRHGGLLQLISPSGSLLHAGRKAIYISPLGNPSMLSVCSRTGVQLWLKEGKAAKHQLLKIRLELEISSCKLDTLHTNWTLDIANSY